jgi:hypothetical protein
MRSIGHLGVEPACICGAFGQTESPFFNLTLDAVFSLSLRAGHSMTIGRDVQDIAMADSEPAGRCGADRDIA